MIGDIYAPSFKSTLRKWLQSIPKFPKPFDMTFVKLSEVLAGLGKHFIDEECKEQCSTQVQYFMIKQSSFKENFFYRKAVMDFILTRVTSAAYCVIM